MRGTAYQSQDHFDLLPFINILMCTLGCLLLVALSMAALSLGSAGEEWGFLSRPEDKNHKIPVLIEWNGATLIAHFGDDAQCATFSVPGKPPDTAAGTPCPPGVKPIDLSALLQIFKDKRATHYALLALRPSGFATFNELRGKFADSQIEIGYEPIVQGKSVKLNLGARSP